MFDVWFVIFQHFIILLHLSFTANQSVFNVSFQILKRSFLGNYWVPIQWNHHPFSAHEMCTYCPAPIKTFENQWHAVKWLYFSSNLALSQFIRVLIVTWCTKILSECMQRGIMLSDQKQQANKKLNIDCNGSNLKHKWWNAGKSQIKQEY